MYIYVKNNLKIPFKSRIYGQLETIKENSVSKTIFSDRDYHFCCVFFKSCFD